MRFESQDPNLKLHQGFIRLHTQQFNTNNNNYMDMEFREQHHNVATIATAATKATATRPPPPFRSTYNNTKVGGGKQREYLQRTFSQQQLKRGYFGIESLFLLICLTVSLLILPLVLPPLPPPPFLLLLLPIGILGLLMILAFMPSNVRDLTYLHI